jgi:hypothetical protein
MTTSPRALTAATLALALASPTLARAQQALIGASIGGASGLEIGDGGQPQTVWRLARTRAAASVDWRSDEDPRTIYLGQIFAELEPATSLGAELRYGRAVGSYVEAYLGASATLAPATLFGPVVAARYYPLGAKHEWSPFLEPSLTVMPFGTDLPSSKALVWSLLTLGVRLDLSSTPSSEP